MANKTTAELTAASALSGSELVHVVQGGNSRRSTTLALLTQLFKNDLSGSFDDADRILARANLGALAASLIGSGHVIQSVEGTYAANAALTAQIPYDDTVPQVTEGTQIISVSLTPKFSNSKLRCRFTGQASYSGVDNVTAALFTGASANAFAAQSLVDDSGRTLSFAFERTISPATTSAVTVSARVGPAAAISVYFNGATAGRRLGGASCATLVVEEISA